ncbi:unnamed protein product, partial [Scytosiphon promiscuus]
MSCPLKACWSRLAVRRWGCLPRGRRRIFQFSVGWSRLTIYAYCCTRKPLCLSWAIRLTRRIVRCRCLCPGDVDSSRISGFPLLMPRPPYRLVALLESTLSSRGPPFTRRFTHRLLLSSPRPEGHLAQRRGHAGLQLGQYRGLGQSHDHHNV